MPRMRQLCFSVRACVQLASAHSAQISHVTQITHSHLALRPSSQGLNFCTLSFATSWLAAQISFTIAYGATS